MKNTAAIALLVARAAAQDRADMDQDRNKKDDTQRFRAATQEDTCKDDAVSKADGELKTALANHETERKKVEGDGTGAATAAGRGTAGEILAKLTDQNTQTKALAAADLLNKAKVEDDIKLDRLELEARRAWDAKKADEVAKKVLDDAQQLKVTATTKAHSDAKVIFDGATKAKADAILHVTDEETIVTSTLGTMNAAMVTWKGTGVVTALVDAGRTDAQILAQIASATTTPAAKLIIAKTALAAAVGTCTPAANTGTAWTNAACTTVASTTGASTATNLVKTALRKQLGIDNLASSTASRETYLDAYCTAAQQLGATAADITSGKAYWSKANPGVRLDFKFGTTPATLVMTVTGGKEVATAGSYLDATKWTFETLGAPIEAIAINGSEAHPTALAAMTDIEANKALWHVMKCSATPVAAVAASAGVLPKDAVTGKALRVYDNSSALNFRKVAWSASSSSAVGGLANVVGTAKTAKDLATSTTVGLEGTFIAWKTAAKAAMDAYDDMITTDVDFDQVGLWKCQDTTIKAVDANSTIGVSTNVDYASCIEALVAVTVASTTDGSSKAARPSNLLIAKEDALWTTSNHLAQAKKECQKLPSMGLYVVAEGSGAWKPVLPKEVCQGISYLTTVSTSNHLTTFKADLQFVSKAAANIVNVAHYITIVAPDLSAAVLASDGTTASTPYRHGSGVHTCRKRKNEKGVAWRKDTAKAATNFPANADAVTNLAAASNANSATGTLNSSTTMSKAYYEGAAFTGGFYLPVNASKTTTANGKYALFKEQMDAWVVLRVAVHTKYAAYLVLKEVVTATGQLFRTEIQTVKRNQARLTGTTTTNTNGNLTDLYANAWKVVYGTVRSEIPALVTTMASGGTGNTYTHMLPTSYAAAGRLAPADTSKYSLWQVAVKNNADADKAHKDAQALWNTATAAVVAQKAVKDKATTELAAIDKIYGAVGVAGKTGALKKVEDDAKVITKKAFDDAVIVTGTYSGKFDTAKKNSSDAAALQLTKDAYAAIKIARDKADKAVLATTEALKADKLARAELKKMLDAKVVKDVAVAKALTTCKNTKYDNYKATLKAAVSNRDKNLKLIKELLEKKDKAAVAAGATGARCNKGLSQGNGKARAAKPCTVETDCCGAAKGPVLAATAAGYWKDAPVMTIETCQPATQKTYKYAPPRAPMATTDPADAANAASQQDWPFVCIGGASKLAAAASALATAAYMMA